MQNILQRVIVEMATKNEILREVDEHSDTLRYVVIRQDGDSVRDILASVSASCAAMDLVSLAVYLLKSRNGGERDRFVQRHLERALKAAKD